MYERGKGVAEKRGVFEPKQHAKVGHKTKPKVQLLDAQATGPGNLNGAEVSDSSRDKKQDQILRDKKPIKVVAGSKEHHPPVGAGQDEEQRYDNGKEDEEFD